MGKNKTKKKKRKDKAKRQKVESARMKSRSIKIAKDLLREAENLDIIEYDNRQVALGGLLPDKKVFEEKGLFAAMPFIDTGMLVVKSKEEADFMIIFVLESRPEGSHVLDSMQMSFHIVGKIRESNLPPMWQASMLLDVEYSLGELVVDVKSCVDSFGPLDDDSIKRPEQDEVTLSLTIKTVPTLFLSVMTQCNEMLEGKKNTSKGLRKSKTKNPKEEDLPDYKDEDEMNETRRTIRLSKDIKVIAKKDSKSSPTGRKYTKRDISWGVRGHMRHYKNGKVVYIKPYTKSRGDKKVNKTYKI